MKTALSVALACWLCLACGSLALAENYYVTDFYEITLRKGPTLENKILMMLKNDTPLEKLKDEGDWLYVREPGGKEGWVMKRYITTKTPLSLQFEQYKEQNKDLIAKAQNIQAVLAKYEDEKTGLKKIVDEQKAELDRLKRDYASLRESSGDVAGLHAAYQEAKAELEKKNEEMERLASENKKLNFLSDIKWFLAGAGVICFGALVGFISGRAGRKRASRLSL